MTTKKQSKEAQRKQGRLQGWVAPILIILALFLASCGGAPAAPAAPATTEEPAPAAAEATEPAEEVAEATEAPAAAPAEKTKVAFWYDPTFSAEQSACFVAQVVDTFNAQSKLAEVEATAQPNNWDATRTALAGGSGPDVVTTPGPSFAFELAKAGQLAPLDDFAQEFGWADIFVPWALDLGKVDGVLYSIPAEQESLVLYYNKTLFDEKGWQPPKTIDELMALSEKIAAEDIIPFAHANAEWRAANEWFVGEMLNHGAGPQSVYEALTGKRAWDDPEFVAALEILNTMQKNGWFMGGLDRYYTTPGDEAGATFGDGKAAMKIEGTWFLGEIDNFFGEAAGNQNEWDWVPVPSTGGEAIFDLGIGSTYSINKNTQSPQAVAEFITYLFSPETQARLVVECNYGAAPVRLEAGALEGIDPRRARVYEALAEASVSNNYGYTTWTFWPPKSDVYIYEEVEKVWAGDITSEQYLAGLQKLFAEELEAGDIPPIPTRE
jgi:raffinose/stachyose/melibiose transport system substrate-binding protein